MSEEPNKQSKLDYDIKRAEEALWQSPYFTNQRYSMFESLKYIECQEVNLEEILNTIIPMNKKFKDFAAHYVFGKDRYIKLTRSYLLEKAQNEYLDVIIAQIFAKMAVNDDIKQGIEYQINKNRP